MTVSEPRYPMGRCCEGGKDGKKHTDTCEFTEHGTRKVARAEPSRGAPSWSKMMAEMQPCGHTNAQHLYHDSGDIKIDLSACLVHTSIEHAGQTSGGTTADVAKAASAAPDASRGAPDGASPGALRAARTIFRHMPPDDPKVIATAEEIDRESGHVVLLEALQAAKREMVGLAAYMETCEPSVIVDNLPGLAKALNLKVDAINAALGEK